MSENLKIDPYGFREYDARWLYGKDINDEGITNLGKGLGTQIIKHTKKTSKYSIDLIIRQIIREIINVMVSDVILTTHKNIKKYKIKNLNDIYNTKFLLVTFSNKMKIFDTKIKKFLRQKMYFHKKVNSKTNYGRKVITKLFTSIRRNPKKYIDIKKYNNSNFERIICDYIAGMTDRYAINLYNQIK